MTDRHEITFEYGTSNLGTPGWFIKISPGLRSRAIFINIGPHETLDDAIKELHLNLMAVPEIIHLTPITP